MKDHNDSLIAQVNSKTVENADLKAQIQEKFASQVDVKNDLPKPVTPHYLPKVREYVFTKPYHVIASSDSRNNSNNMPRFSSNDMVDNHYLEEAKKKTRDSQLIRKTAMASEQFGLGPELQLMTPGTISSGLVQNPSSLTPYVPPTKKYWDIMFQPMFDEYFQPSPNVVSYVLPAVAPILTDTTGTPSSTSIDQDAPAASTSPTSHETQSPVIFEGVEEQLQPS
ncbi:hypothetical protein Tco_0242645 [Tanacetum coccineum]